MGGKFKIIISDLHLGAGFADAGNGLEDFTSGAEFAGLLAQFQAESEASGLEVELLINGDAFEMLQTPNLETFEPAFPYPPQVYLSSSEPDSVRKMQLIVAGHPRFFQALRTFVHHESPRRSVTFLKGNHDINLHWRGVQAVLRQAVAAHGDRTSLLRFVERSVNREGIYVEHGNQYASVFDRLDDFEEPHDPERLGQLQLPPGSYFVIHAFNQVERARYWVDGVKPITALIWYALAFDVAWAMEAIRILLAALPDVLYDLLLVAPEPGAPAQPSARPELQALRDDLYDPALVERYTTDADFRADFQGRLARTLGSPLPAAEVAPAAAPAGTDMAGAGLADPVARGQAIQKQVNSALFDAAAEKERDVGAQVVVFGHTHDPVTETLPGGGTYLNTGTWTWSADLTGASRDTWRELFEHPERFTDSRQFTYVRVDYDATGRPGGRRLTYEPRKTPPAPVPDAGSPGWWQRVQAWLQRVRAWLEGVGR
jgi:UDP-2,3-diacylglucosamine pyrophosphatase LpxH